MKFPPLIIVEGPDCSGKTSLASWIAKQRGYVYMHMSGHPALHAAMPEYHDAVLKSIAFNIQVNGVKFVLDRSWPSEVVYGREFRPHLVDRFPVKEFQDRIKKLGGHYIFCMDPMIEERYAKKHQSTEHHRNYDRAEFHNIVIAYQAMMLTMQTRPDYTHYDLLMHGMSLDLTWDRIEEAP